MSITSWKKEFCPPISKTTPETALDHSIKKWKGLSKKNITKHKLNLINGTLFYGKRKLEITEENCALCHHFKMDSSPMCGRCPIYKNLATTCILDFEEFRDYGNSKPLLQLLKLVKKHQSTKRKQQNEKRTTN